MKRFVCSLLICGIFVGSTYASVPRAGSESDPLVSKSYVDLLESRVDELSRLVELNSELILEMQKLEEAVVCSGWEIISVEAGQTILGEQGTSFIVRSGEGSVLASMYGGVQDVTLGVDIPMGELAPKNHLLIIPRGDGRGVFAHSDLIVMVDGGYEIY